MGQAQINTFVQKAVVETTVLKAFTHPNGPRGPIGPAGPGFGIEIPTDNGDGTYTFTHVPDVVQIQEGLGIPDVDYTVIGNTITLINPSGPGWYVMGIFGATGGGGLPPGGLDGQVLTIVNGTPTWV